MTPCTRPFLSYVLSTLSLLSCLIASGPIDAKPLVLDQPYQGPVKLEVGQLGLSFKLPKGWQGVAPSSGEGFMATYGEGVQVILAPAPYSMEQIKRELKEGAEVAPGVYLSPKGKLKTYKDGSIGGEFSMHGAEMAKIYTMVKPIKQRAPVVILGVCIKNKKSCKGYVKRFYQSVKSVAKSKPKLTQPKGSLAARLANKKLSRYFHGSGYSEKSTMILCADGRYFSSFNASSLSINGTGVMDSNGAGQWSVRGTTLTVREANGSTRSFQVSYTSERLLLNQDRWLREDYSCR